MFIKPAAFDEVATSLAVDDFFLPAHREIFEAMLAIDKRRQPLDVIAVADELKVARACWPAWTAARATCMELANARPDRGEHRCTTPGSCARRRRCAG